MVLMESNPNALKLGDTAPAFSLKGTEGKTYSLQSFKTAKALLVIFMCNHCPFVKPKFETIKNLQAKYKDKGLVVLGINPNDPVKYPDDNFDNMVKIAHEKKFNFYYLWDETQQTAKKYGATCTPDPFLFDAQQILVYHARIDDAHGPDKVPTTHEMDDAIAELLKTGKVTVKQLPSMGCSIKWKL